MPAIGEPQPGSEAQPVRERDLKATILGGTSLIRRERTD